MKNVYVGLLAAVACTYSMQAAANSLNSNLNFTVEGNVPFSLHPSSASHTVTPLDLGPISSLDNAVKLAAVRSIASHDDATFGTSNSAEFDVDLDTNNQCRDEGYSKTSCDVNMHPDDSTRCPHNPEYFKECLCDTSYYTVEDGNQGSVCGKFATIEACEDKNGTHYACRCNPSIDNLTLCAGNSEYISEADYRKNIVEGNNYCRDNRDLGIYYYPQHICQSCALPYVVNTAKNACGCPVEYKECDMGPEIGANSCTENGITKYDRCKACAYRGTHTSCPTGYACSFEQCSGKYEITGCAVGKMNISKCSWMRYFTKSYCK
ncbi:MAG: hypothetical protein J6A33_00920 [Alphaproteobacteria bacterium]|nr:hypothetical protein [Alphaproteobacteria bacterium]